MSILPGMRDFNRDHVAHKPYTLKDRGGNEKSCQYWFATLTFEIRLGQEKAEIVENKQECCFVKVQSFGVKVQRSF